jgi:hypothetical protein
VWVAEDHYSVEGLDFSVRSTDASFLELLRGYLPPIQAKEGAEAARFQVDCGRPRVLPGGKVMRPTANLYVGRLRIFCGPRWEDMAGRLVTGVRDMATSRANETIRLRAVGVVIDGKAVILPARPNPHLPALAGLLVRAGAGFLGDEMVKLDPILRRVHGVALPLLVDVSDLDHFPEVDGRARRKARHTGDQSDRGNSRTPRRVVPVNVLGGYHAPPAELGAITFPVFAPGEDTRAEAIGASDGIFRIMEATLNGHVWGERALILARDLIETVPTQQLVVGSLPEAVELLMGRGSS